MTIGVESSEIYHNLWQGSQPRTGTRVRDSGFDLLILCAEEYQPPASSFPGVEVIYAPNQDDPKTPPSRKTLYQALAVARKAAQAMKDGRKVLSTCYAGINRSGLVSALTLRLYLGCSGFEAVRLVQQRRMGALRNPQFVKVLEQLQ